MNSKGLNEVQKKYENEFCEFLIQRINHAGGSLQFQHLSGLLQQLRFEVRDAFGTTKSQLMKFLRGHPKIFKIDSKGVVTILDNSLLGDCDIIDINKNNNEKAKDSLLPKIENGIGTVSKISPEFAIIRAAEPIKAYVYFTPPEYGASKDSLFIDLGLEVKTKVCFNAVLGHSGFEIEYRATKVWRKPDSDDEISDSEEDCTANKKVLELSSEGIIQKVLPKLGYISILDKKNQSVLFYKNIVKDCDVDLTDFFKIGDRVKFTAESIKPDSKSQWLATEVIKIIKKNPSQQSSEINFKGCDIGNVGSKKKIENQLGKIYPYAHGAVIKFGKNYSEIADGDSSNYFLYGSEVSDVMYEYLEGDDVRFDAIKTRSSPGWKAVLVWVGEKPAVANCNRQHFEEECVELYEKMNHNSSSDNSSENINSLVKSKTVRSKTIEHEVKNKNKKSFDHSVNRRLAKSETECRQNNVVIGNSIVKHEVKKKNKSFDHSLKRKLVKSEGVCRSKNLDACKTISQTISSKKSRSRKSNNRPDMENIFVRKSKESRSRTQLNKTLNLVEENYNSLLSSRESVLDVNLTESKENSSEDDKEFENVTHNFKKFLKTDEHEKSVSRSSSSENEISSDDNSHKIKSKIPENGMKKKNYIKKFEDIDGQITHLFCKAAMINSPHLQTEIDFVLNVFYLNGKCVEEQQVIDLKEVIKIGDTIKFNCFEIVDDFGDIYRKVTMAWKGPKPKVYEMTPEEFILEHELSVSACDDLENNSVSDNDSALVSACDDLENNSVSDNDSALVNEIPQKYFLEVVNSTDFDDVPKFHSETNSLNVFENEPEKEINEKIKRDDHKLLSERISQRLKDYGLVSLDSEVDLHPIVDEIINVVLKDTNVESLNQSLSLQSTESSSEMLCSSCKKKSKPFLSNKSAVKHAEVQTIITGEIVATSIYTQN